MKRAIIKGVLLGIIFAAALMILSTVMNQGNTDMTTEMAEATYPVLSMSIGTHRVGSLHGYAQAMDCAYLRDHLQPVSENRRINVRMDTYGQKISEIAFEVRSLDGERLVESTPVEAYTEKEDVIDFEITLKDLIENDTEYMLVFLVTPQESAPIRYYSRIVLSDSLHIYEKLDYIMDFHERTFDKEAAAELTKYLESNAEGDNTTFHRVTIHSSFNQVTWGDLEVRELSDPVVTVKELAEQTGSFTLEYPAFIKNGKQNEFYRIKEYYRVRYTPDRMYLLDFERTMEQIFDEEAGVYVNDKIVLGITGDQVTLLESDGGNVFAFTVADKLYSYNVTDNRLARLFSFYGNTEGFTDARSAYNRHDIRVLSVDETGNILFLVYGYMNRGRHEGCVGAAFYAYNSMTNTVEEMIYIPYDRSYELLKTEIDNLSYISRTGIYYFMLDGSVYAVDVKSLSVQTLVTGLKEGSYHVSQSNQMLVWQEGGNLYGAEDLILMNLNTQTRTRIPAGNGEYISVVGFMGEDLIYGLARKRDVRESRTGITTFPMYCLKIQGDDGDVLKTYQKEGIYVVDSEITENQITLSRIAYDAETDSYVPASEDQIMNTQEMKIGSNTLESVVTETYETICEIAVKEEIDEKSLVHLTPKEILFEGSRSVGELEKGAVEERFYVYGKNGIENIYVNPGKAVDLAYRSAGVVVDDDGDYVWKREARSTRNQIMAITENEVTETKSSLAVCLDTILKFEGISRNTQRRLDQGDTVFGILESDLADYTILDLSGCSLDAVLYYVNKDIPVLATLEDGNAVLITGFNELNIVVMDPVEGTLEKRGMNDSTEWLAANGNQFIAYVRKE
ncbi:MAG: hypothetical protein NC302_12440 [Bacteroidales bacterium]|nr:hypothetical protein [Bacteroidales bacterium]MCM1416171.1 hypothetical protein [bacterium]MCM1424196.1 hypothetical protein [bacterium]